jgi:hypothetical protein
MIVHATATKRSGVGEGDVVIRSLGASIYMFDTEN